MRIAYSLAGLIVLLSTPMAAAGEPVPLFDGATLAGWHGGSTIDPRAIPATEQAKFDAEVPLHWQAKDGELVSDGHGPNLVTKQNYRDFELWVDWWLAPNGDSGIYLRGCPQVQIWDPANTAAHVHGSDKGSGGLWNNKLHPRFPTSVADRPTGQWNTMRVRMVGPYVQVELNGQVIVDNVVLENYFDAQRPVFATGAIHLQTHGSETRFRNLKIRDIEPTEAAQLLAEIAGGEAGFTPMLSGHGFDGWFGAIENYQLVDGVIRVKPNSGGNLLTSKQYSDFVWRLEFRLPPGGNNGLAIRSPGPEVDAAYQGVELQVLDDTDPKYAELRDYQFHGSAYGLVPAQRGYLRPVGEWNYQQVTIAGTRFQVELNGYKILDTDLATVRDKPTDGGEHPGAFRTAGHLGFCGHGDPVEFRNLRIRPLTAE